MLNLVCCVMSCVRSMLYACNTSILHPPRFNISPSGTIELLNRMAKVFKDYCGILTEESIRKNFILVYELLDEMLDFG
jgi:AP-4 complex subunit mu-1